MGGWGTSGQEWAGLLQFLLMGRGTALVGGGALSLRLVAGETSLRDKSTLRWQGRVEELAGFWVARGSSNWAPEAAPAAAALGPGGGPRAVRILLAWAKRRSGAQMPASEEWWQGNPLKWEPGRLDLEDIPGRRRKRNSLAGDAGLGECGAWWRAICLCVRPGRVLEVGGGGPGRQRELKRARGRIITLPCCWPS